MVVVPTRPLSDLMIRHFQSGWSATPCPGSRSGWVCRQASLCPVLRILNRQTKGRGERKETVLWTVLASSQPVGGVGLEHAGTRGVGDLEVIEIDIGVQGGLVAQVNKYIAFFWHRKTDRKLCEFIGSTIQNLFEPSTCLIVIIIEEKVVEISCWSIATRLAKK